ncbi:Nop14-like protein [Myriangium duriaei CBS 260.36]|uniref:Nop14-like protein n=1 Tax=Myriangium duriaei CBS 260.36 TaxID=1168546 RepID=A0A9P4MIF5_9PEZI|nr:Nop14-like protein [Myriangium duriaei CBS 260.36]
MPPSQLKRLKQSLREQGITGPQKSKKQKKQSHGQNADQRLQRDAALQQIRDSFNPFEIKAPTRNAKFSSMSDRNTPAAVGRPGVTKSMGEKTRRQNLLPELQRRNKSGGIVDRRIGEDDATMTPEERALQRFVREKSRRKNGSMFDLEGDDDEETGLTHLGKALSFAGGADDDFDAGSLAGSDDGSEGGSALLKRRRDAPSDDEDVQDEEDAADENQPARKKTKQEVMKEVIAKSKLHKFERQKAKEDDDELRAKLDSEMGDMLSLLIGRKPEPPKSNGGLAKDEPAMNADRLAMLQGKSREAADKEYDTRLRQMAQDQRAAPADKTKTEEEKAKVEAERLKKLEDARQRRMLGEEVEDESGDEREKAARGAIAASPEEEDDEDARDDAAEFGLSAPSAKAKMPVLDDEDEFELDDDLIASESEEGSETYDSAEDSDDSDDEGERPNGWVSKTQEEDEEDEFVKGILDKIPGSDKKQPKPDTPTQGIAFTYPCPRSHTELLDVFSKAKDEDVPLIIQRIRALYHPSLSAENKEKLADFSCSLVEHLAYLGLNKGSLQVIETITRHLHSLSRTFPERIAGAFRDRLRVVHERNNIDVGDFVVLTAIGSIYPTSDHFHQVVTPAITLMARWLGMTSPSSEAQLIIGANVVSLSLHYQRLSKRYVPEALRFTLKALQFKPHPSAAVSQAHLANFNAMAEQYRHLSAFTEIFHPGASSVLSAVKEAKSQQQHLQILLSQARLSRRPLALHNHRPLAIRTSVPKFEESFAPGKHYDPDKDRSDAAKLRKEYKRERKGAMRELRKDANFIAREQLREKKEADQAYEKKFRRLVAEINSEEGRGANEYAREKDRRKRAKK